MPQRTLCAAILLFALASSALVPTLCAQQEHEGKTVVAIEFVGATLASADSVRAQMKTKIGQPLRTAELNEDMKDLAQRLKLFSSVSQRVTAVDGGVKIQFFVAENPRVEEVFFLGNLEYSRGDLLDVVETRKGGLADDITLELDVQRLREKYLDAGFHFVQVRHQKVVEDFTTVVFDITEGPEVGVEEVKFLGVTAFDKDDLLEAMPFTDENGFLSDHSYVEEDVSKDLVSLQQFYRGKGFLDAEVTLVDRSFSRDKEDVVLTISVIEGAGYTVRSITFEGMTRFSEDEILPEMKTAVGARYERGFLLANDMTAIRRRYWDEAFINVRIDNDSKIPIDGTEIDVLIRVDERDQVRVGKIDIEGNVETRDKVIRRLLEDLAPGSPLNQNTLDRARRRIVNLRYFDPASVTAIKEPITLPEFEDYTEAFLSVVDTDKEHIKDINLEVEELDTGSIKFAVGVNSSAGLVGAIVYRKDNFDPLDPPEDFGDIFDAFTGGGQALELAFYPGVELTQFQARYTHPFIFDTDYEFDVTLFRRLRIRERHDESRTGFNVAVGKRFGYNISASIRYRFEYVEVDDVEDDAPQLVFDFEGERLVSSLIFGIRVADLDDFRSPAQGFRIKYSYEYAGLGGDLEFHKNLLEAEYYQTLSTDIEDRKHVLFFKGKLGYVTESGGSHDVPIYERFFAGGQNSIRGFEFRGVGPMDSDVPIGGKAMWLGSLNYEFPLYEKILNGVIFLDAGSLTEEFNGDLLADFRASVGFGIRLSLSILGPQPIPFAIDFGFPLLKEGDDQTQLISFSLDQRF